MESKTKNRKTREQVALMVERAFGGVSESMRGYGKTTFTHEEDERCHLYTLHLALVMKTECYYRKYDSDFVSNLSKHLMVPTMSWPNQNGVTNFTLVSCSVPSGVRI